MQRKFSVLAISMTIGLAFAACDKDGDLGDTGNAEGGADEGGADEGGADEGGADEGGADEGGADEGGADEGGADEGGADEGGADEGGADEGGADEGGADEGGADEGGADEGGADEGGGDPPELCDPLVQDCSEGETCTFFEDEFQCLPQAGDGVSGDACDGADTCNPGLGCVNADDLDGCEEDGGSCCAEFCDLSDPHCDSGECEAWFDAGAAQPGLEDVGVCTSV